jgi:tetratricopeptide (TPR) repeat protein
VQAQLDAAQSHKEAGNVLFKEKKFDGALEEFLLALDCAPPDAQERAVYHANSAACYLLQQMYRECVASCTEALLIHATYQKALLRRMVAFEALDELENALRDAQQARSPCACKLWPSPCCSELAARPRRDTCYSTVNQQLQWPCPVLCA